MVYRYPKEVHEFVKAHMSKLRDDDLAEACNKALGTNFTKLSMKAFRGNHGYRNGKKQWTTEEYWKYQKRYPKGMYEFVRDNSWGVSSKDMAEMVNKKFGTDFSETMMKQFRQRQGIKSGEKGWYRKGNEPANKGKHLEDYLPAEKAAEVRERIAATQFKKGHSPHNEMPVGTITKNPDGYLIRKKKMTGGQWERWEFLHKDVWKEHHGEIPEGMVVVFKNHNKENCDIENLMLVSRAELLMMARKGYFAEDPDLTEAGARLVRLKIKASKRKKAKSD